MTGNTPNTHHTRTSTCQRSPWTTDYYEMDGRKETRLGDGGNDRGGAASAAPRPTAWSVTRCRERAKFKRAPITAVPCDEFLMKEFLTNKLIDGKETFLQDLQRCAEHTETLIKMENCVLHLLKFTIAHIVIIRDESQSNRINSF